MELQVGTLFNRISNSRKKIVVNQGGSRSGKTYSTLQFLIIDALESQKHKTYSIVRKTLPALKGTVLKDFIEILDNLGLYNERDHNKSDHVYKLNGSSFEFFSLDQSQKVRGRKRDVLFINEANELSLEDWRQLIIRTTDRAYLDFNPSDEYHWIYEQVLTRDDCEFIQSTYLDNPFLEQTIIDEIEKLKDIDHNFWRVYGLGERGVSMESIYTHFKEVETIPDADNYCYGLDFGFNHPTALIKVSNIDGVMYAEEVIYKSGLTTTDLIRLMDTLVPNKRKEIFADSADPKAIEEIYRAGYNIKFADKDVVAGINKVKSVPLYLLKNSYNLVREMRNYKWKKDRNDRTLDEPVKFNDDACDGLRYAIYNFEKSNITTYKPKIYHSAGRF